MKIFTILLIALAALLVSSQPNFPPFFIAKLVHLKNGTHLNYINLWYDSTTIRVAAENNRLEKRWIVDYNMVKFDVTNEVT